jgi:hypothetical protein
VLDSSLKLRRWYDRLSECKKGLGEDGLTTAGVLAEIYQMLKKEEYRYGRDPVNHTGKLADYRRLLKRCHKKAILEKTA